MKRERWTGGNRMSSPERQMEKVIVCACTCVCVCACVFNWSRQGFHTIWWSLTKPREAPCDNKHGQRLGTGNWEGRENEQTNETGKQRDGWMDGCGCGLAYVGVV